MIRQMACLRIPALLAALGIASAGTPTVIIAAALEGPTHSTESKAGWVVEVRDNRGNVVDFDKLRLQPASRDKLTSPALPVDIDKARQELTGLKFSTDPRTVARATRLLQYLDIATAKTPAERHARIQKLPVTITTAPATDGRDGVVKSFAAGGKIRLRLFVANIGHAPEESTAHRAGPAVGDECYDGAEEPCATPEEMDDMAAALADAQAEGESDEANYESEYNDYMSWCGQTPDGCNDAPVFHSGPSADATGFDGCLSEAGNATAGAIGASSYALLGWARLYGAAEAGLAIGAIEAGGWVLGAVAVGYWSGYYLGEFVACKRAKPRLLFHESPLALRLEEAY